MAYNLFSVDSAFHTASKHNGFSTSILGAFSTASFPQSIDWDGTYTYIGRSVIGDNKAIRYTGFTSSIASSFSTPGSFERGVAWDGTNLATNDAGNDKYYGHDGFSGALISSFTDASPGSVKIADIGWWSTSIISVNYYLTPKIRQHSGFTNTIASSFAAPGAYPQGLKFDGLSALSSDPGTNLIYWHDGFTSSIQSSIAQPYGDTTGVCAGDRQGIVYYKTLEGTLWTLGTLATKYQAAFTGEISFVGALSPQKQTRNITLQGALSFVGDVGNTDPWNPNKPWDPEDPEFDPTDPDKPQYKGGVQWHKLLTGAISFLSSFAHAKNGGSRTFLKTLEGTLWADGEGEGVGTFGTRRDGPSPPAPHPPETGVTFRRSRTGQITFIGAEEEEQFWPHGLFDKGTLDDSMVLIDTVTSGGPSGKVSTSRNHPHRGKYYLAVHKPEKIFWGEVDSVTPNVGGTEVTYINSGGTRTSCYWGMTVKVYDSTGEYKGKVRLRPGLNPTTLPVAEQDDLDWTIGDLFEVYDVVELWARFPRVIIDPGDPAALIWYRDWDVTPADAEFPMQIAHNMCVPIIGPPTCAFLDGGSASIYFTAKDSYNVNPLVPPAWWYWRFFESGSVMSSSNLETPGDITWTAAGVHRVECQIETGVPTWVGYPAFRYIHIFERTGENAPYTNFKVENLSGNVSEGGWSATFEVYSDAEIADFPAGAQVILFAEEELGGYDFGSEDPPGSRSEVKYVGYIIDGSVSKNPDSRVVTFNTAGVQHQMKNRDNFSLALDYVAETTADDWTEQDVLSANYAFMNLVLWNSTLMSITDVFLPTYYYETWPSISHKASEAPIKFQDFPRGTLWRQLDTLATDVFARIIVNRFGIVSIANNPQDTVEADLWADLPVPYTFGTLDWQTPLTIEFVDEPVSSVICIEGVAFDGTTATAVIGYYPGALPTYRGRIVTQSGCVLTSQNEAEFLAQRRFSVHNSTYPRVILTCLGNYSFVDLTDYGGLQMSLDAADTRFGLAWTNQRLFVVGVSNTIDFITGLLTTEIELATFATLYQPDAGA